MSALVAHAGKNSGQKQTKSVKRAEVAHVDESVAPALPVLQSGDDVALVIFLCSA